MKISSLTEEISQSFMVPEAIFPSRVPGVLFGRKTTQMACQRLFHRNREEKIMPFKQK